MADGEGAPTLGSSRADTFLLVLSGIVSTTPLLLFTAAAKRLALFDARDAPVPRPTLQFLIAVLLYGEPFTSAHAIAFTAIWVALALYVVALVRSPRLPSRPNDARGAAGMFNLASLIIGCVALVLAVVRLPALPRLGRTG